MQYGCRRRAHYDAAQRVRVTADDSGMAQRLPFAEAVRESNPCVNVRELLITQIPAIMDRWMLAIDRAPWSNLTAAHRQDQQAEFLGYLFAWAVRGPDTSAKAAAFLDAALAHGRQRRDLGLDYDRVMEECALLRRAIFETPDLSACPDAFAARIDAGLTVALMASLAGYSQPELETAGRWEEQRTRLIDDACRLGG